MRLLLPIIIDSSFQLILSEEKNLTGPRPGLSEAEALPQGGKAKTCS
jgi:hypothetical protein